VLDGRGEGRGEEKYKTETSAYKIYILCVRVSISKRISYFVYDRAITIS